MTTRTKFWLVTLAAIVAVGVTLSLGRWQLSRAAQKEDLQAALVTQGRRVALDNVELISAFRGEAGQKTTVNQSAAVGTLIHRRALLRGTWVAASTVFLDNRQMDARPGFFVVTPLLLQGTAQAVLVQRGWVPRDFQDRGRLPTVGTPPGLVEINGRIASPPSKLVNLGQDGQGPIRQNLDMTAFANETGLALLPVSLVQINASSGSAAPQDGLLRNWPMSGASAASASASKNYGYAVQWFALSALTVVLYTWFGLVRPMRNKRQQDKPA